MSIGSGAPSGPPSRTPFWSTMLPIRAWRNVTLRPPRSVRFSNPALTGLVMPASMSIPSKVTLDALLSSRRTTAPGAPSKVTVFSP